MVMVMKFGDILRQLLEINGLTQKQLGLDLNIAPTTIGNYVRNIREPDHSTIKLFAQYFNVSTDYLLDFHADTYSSHSEDLLVNTFRKLNPTYQDILIKQAQVLLDNQNK